MILVVKGMKHRSIEEQVRRIFTNAPEWHSLAMSDEKLREMCFEHTEETMFWNMQQEYLNQYCHWGMSHPQGVVLKLPVVQQPEVEEVLDDLVEAVESRLQEKGDNPLKGYCRVRGWEPKDVPLEYGLVDLQIPGEMQMYLGVFMPNSLLSLLTVQAMRKGALDVRQM